MCSHYGLGQRMVRHFAEKADFLLLCRQFLGIISPLAYSPRQKTSDFGSQLILRIRLGQAVDVDHFHSFQLGKSRRKQDRKLGALTARFTCQFDSRHPRHRMIRYQEVSSQSLFKELQSLARGVRFNHLMPEVFQQSDGASGDQKIVVDKKYSCTRRLWGDD